MCPMPNCAAIVRVVIRDGETIALGRETDDTDDVPALRSPLFRFSK
jgi:hypothetical protein